MKLTRRALPIVLASGLGLVALGAGPAAAAQTTPAQCIAPVATDFRTPSGGIDTAAYLAAVAAYNECLAGGSGTRTVAAATPSRAIAFTGSNSSELAAIGAAAVGVGAGALLLARRRRPSTADTR